MDHALFTLGKKIDEKSIRMGKKRKKIGKRVNGWPKQEHFDGKNRKNDQTMLNSTFSTLKVLWNAFEDRKNKMFVKIGGIFFQTRTREVVIVLDEPFN